MWWMWIIKLLGGLDINGIAKTAVAGYQAKQDAGVKHDQIASDLQAKEVSLAVQEQELNARIIIAEQGNWLTRMARPAIAFPFIAFLWKTLVWDKLLGLGVTDPLEAWQSQIMMIVVPSYFIGRTVEKVTSVVRNRLGQ